MKPAQANTITRILDILLNFLSAAEGPKTASAVPDEILAEMARRDPAVLNLLAPFLTDEQFDNIAGKQFADGDEEPT
jgi:hypothetical protein